MGQSRRGRRSWLRCLDLVRETGHSQVCGTLHGMHPQVLREPGDVTARPLNYLLKVVAMGLGS